jgi:hypothetical protein
MCQAMKTGEELELVYHWPGNIGRICGWDDGHKKSTQNVSDKTPTF